MLADTPTCNPEKFLPSPSQGLFSSILERLWFNSKHQSNSNLCLLNYIFCVLFADRPVYKPLLLLYYVVLVKFVNFSELLLFPSIVFPLKEVVRLGIIDIRNLANSRSSVNGHLELPFRAPYYSWDPHPISLPQNLSSWTGDYLTIPA